MSCLLALDACQGVCELEKYVKYAFNEIKTWNTMSGS